jgi:hypothetical protein
MPWKGSPGPSGTITADDYVMAFQRWFEQAEKCVKISSNFIKNLEK